MRTQSQGHLQGICGISWGTKSAAGGECTFTRFSRCSVSHRTQGEAFRAVRLDQDCPELQPDQQRHGLQELHDERGDPGAAAPKLGDGLHGRRDDLLHRVSGACPFAGTPCAARLVGRQFSLGSPGFRASFLPQNILHPRPSWFLV